MPCAPQGVKGFDYSPTLEFGMGSHMWIAGVLPKSWKWVGKVHPRRSHKGPERE